MPIPIDVADQFTPQVRARGQEYQRQHRVQLVTADDPRCVEAVVTGSEPYDVTIRARKNGVVTMDCSCPYVEEFWVPCKHIWATLLELERVGHPILPFGEEPGPSGHGPSDPANRARAAAKPAVKKQPPAWRRELERLRQPNPYHAVPAAPAEWPAKRRLAYVIDTTDAVTVHADVGVVLELATQAPAPDGSWKPPKRFGYSHAQWLAVPDPEDREIAQMLVGAREVSPYGYDYGVGGGSVRRFRLPPETLDLTLRRVCATGRCFVRLHVGDENPPLLAWDAGGAWDLRVSFAPDVGDVAHGGEMRCRVEGVLVRGAARLPVDQAAFLARGLVVRAAFGGYLAAPLRDHGALELARHLVAGASLRVPAADVLDAVAELGKLYPHLPAPELPESLGVLVVDTPPRPHLALRPTPPGQSIGARMDATLSFDYGGVVVSDDTVGDIVVRLEARRVVHRDVAAEHAALARLEEVGFKREHDYRRGRPVYRVAVSRVPRAVAELSAEGWAVELEGNAIRTAGSTSVSVTSGIDWFDVNGEVDFGGLTATLPELLAGLRGGNLVALKDGSLGILPADWLARYGALASLGRAVEGQVRFGQGQAALLDAMLASLPDAHIDERFARVRDELHRFEGVAPLAPPEHFVGELRPYQREGLGWLDALRRFSLGGVLADDMGLGKTVQALALLEMRREAGDAEGHAPSLVVVPNSLVFNWQQEAERFTPRLRVLVYAGPAAARRQALAHLADYDLVVTTYGTLRRDVVDFRDVEFDYVILDEAQAIKNAETATAKAARLLRARHRLAMSGTPIENRLAELWSLFEFLNPGMLGALPAFERLTRADASTQAGRDIIARAVRPFILRRTKEQVARDLPDRVEQTLWVDLAPTERRLYDELRDHYRAELLGRIEREGMARSRMHVLEALLRLRQAACHPGLVDRARTDETSSKLDVLVSRVAEAVAEGHKVLVFSQFTSLLAIVRRRLEEDAVTYEYLDGKTRDRKARVERFQQDPACPVFLISLKAGGLGLNLTAADYVFLLDPWWNPAVEAQAIDRAHRIGQRRHVIASRLVARDTVEEKVIELQRSKKELADAIVRADEGAVGRLGKEEIAALLE